MDPVYENILTHRRKEMSNWLWTARQLITKVAVEINPRPSPKLHKDNVLRRPRLKELIVEMSKKDHASEEDIKRRLQVILDEIGYNKNLNIIRWLGYALTKICLNVCSGIYVNYEGVLEIKSKMGRCPVIFVPSHRSYADFIILSYVCFQYDIEIPAIAAGMDFHGMMGMAEVLRNTGAFFMRRSYNNDNLYWTTFKEYVNQIVSSGDLPIEFFIEGTRSRSNKSIIPKYGLINMILKPFFLGQVPDILFVPISINYDRILEERLFAFELLGIPKPRESTTGFFRSLKIIKEKFGNIYFHIGKPIPARDFFDGLSSRCAYSFAPLHSHEISEIEKRIIPSLAHEIIRMQQSSTPVSSFNLIALIINNNLSRNEAYLHRDSLISETEFLIRILLSWGATICEQNIGGTINDSLIVHNNLINCNESGIISLVTNGVRVEEINLKNFKACTLSEEIITYSVPFMILQIYSNPVLYHLVDAAFIMVILRCYGKMSKDELFKQFCTIRSMMFYEFILMEEHYEMVFEAALVKLRNENVIYLKSGDCGILEANRLEKLLVGNIQHFLLIYYVVANVLQELTERINEKTLLSKIQRVIEHLITQSKVFIHPYCMALDAIANCLSGFSKLEAVIKTKRDGNHVYDVNKMEVTKIRTNLEKFISSLVYVKIFSSSLHPQCKM